MDPWHNPFVEPPFANDPPFKVNVPAQTFGLIAAAVAAIEVFFGLLGVLALNNICSICGAVPVTFYLALLVSIGGAGLVAWGGFRMYQLDRKGKALVVYGIGVGILSGLINILAYTTWTYANTAGTFTGFLFGLIVDAVIYYFLAISRFPEEEPLFAAPPPPPSNPDVYTPPPPLPDEPPSTPPWQT